ncbi:MAG: AraC family transcriptional regulator [Pseudonocardiales bacterium]|nr:AraC family transcriptional regulator [Pseudonocardiales bacterium]
MTVIDEAVVGRPSGAAAGVVASYHGYRQNGMAPARHLGLPSPYLTLIFTLDDPLHMAEHVERRRAARSYDTLAGGLHTTPAVLTHDGRQSGIQLQVHPHAARALFGMPAGELAGIDADADAVIGRTALRIRERLGEAKTWPERFAVLDSEVGGLLRNERAGPPPAVTNAWRLLRQRRGAVAIAELADTVGYSDRRLSALFDAEIGLSPKTAARVIRFDHARRAVQASERGQLGVIAAEHGYSDQSHLVRDFVAFTGRSPTRWLAEEFGNVQAAAKRADPDLLS